MLMILHQNDISSLSYIKYLKQKKVEHIDLSLNDLIKNAKVESALLTDVKTSQWLLKNENIFFDNFSGIYHSINYPDKDYFLDFKEEDIEYARSEWYAYLLYELSSHKNCLNPICHKQFVGTHLSLLNIYKNCDKHGFLAPEYEYLYDKSHDDILCLKENNYILKDTIYDCINYKKANKTKSPVLAIKIYSGAQIVSHIIDNKVFSKIKFSDSEYLYELEDKVRDACISLMDELGIKIAEFFIIKTKDNKYYLYHVSPYPNWNIMGDDKVLVWEELTNALSTTR